MVGEMMSGWQLVKNEARSIGKNLKVMANDAMYGPVGLVSQPVRFFFFATALGVSQMLFIQVVHGALNKSMDEDA